MEKKRNTEEMFSVNSADCQLMEIDQEKMEAKFIAVPTQITIDGRAVYVPGVDLKQFDERKTILWGHHDDLLIGHSMWSKKITDGNGEKAVLVGVNFKPDDMGRYVYEGVRDGWFKFVSPGLMPVESYYDSEAISAYKEDYGKTPKVDLWYYGRKTLMYELSVVNVPAWSGAQKMNLNNMPDKMKKVLAFDEMINYITRVDDLEKRIITLAETLGSQNFRIGDGQDSLDKEIKSSGDVSKIDTEFITSIFKKHLKGDS